MIELNVTNFFNEATPNRYQNSVADTGLQNIGRITWNRAKEDSHLHSFATEDNREELVDWLARFGAWSREEMKDWTLEELNALMIQFVASWVLEKEDLTWQEYYEKAESGQISGNLFESDGEVYALVSPRGEFQ